VEPVLHCEGAPRDLGRAQGVGLRTDVQGALDDEGLSAGRSRWPSFRPLASGPVLGQGIGREIIRHYPHQGERLSGIALGAERSLASLVEKNVRGVARELDRGTGSAALGAPGESGWLARQLEEPSAPCERWILRRSIPEVGFASVELTRSWFVSCFAGVNEEGLGVVLTGEAAAKDASGLAASLLVADCLQRFTSVDACIDWCQKRPAFEGGGFLVADAMGDQAQILLGATQTRAIRAHEGLLVSGVSGEVEVALRKAVANRDAQDGPPGQEATLRVLRQGLGATSDETFTLDVHLSPKRRSLRLLRAREGTEVASLDASRKS